MIILLCFRQTPDERFKRIWEFYFHYCEAGFKADTINVRQLAFEKA